MPGLTRRDWLAKGLALLAATGCGAFLVDIWLSAGRFSANRWVQLAALDSLPGDGVYPFPEKKAALVVSAGRIGAISLECTHLGCLVNTVDAGFYCPCHGSEFGPRGEVYSGPATRPLPWHALRIAGGRVWLRTGSRQGAPQWVTHDAAGRG